MSKIQSDGSKTAHKFEAAQLGRYPFRYTGCSESTYQACPGAPVQPGSSCDYCGTGIRYVFHVQDADGKTFKVGSDCIRHAFNDAQLTVVVESEVRRLKREKAHAKKLAMAAADKARAIKLEPKYFEALEVLTSQPHPNEYFAGQGKTLADYYKFFEFGISPARHPRLDKALAAIQAAGL